MEIQKTYLFLHTVNGKRSPHPTKAYIVKQESTLLIYINTWKSQHFLCAKVLRLNPNFHRESIESTILHFWVPISSVLTLYVLICICCNCCQCVFDCQYHKCPGLNAWGLWITLNYRNTVVFSECDIQEFRKKPSCATRYTSLKAKPK